ncbi:hypothetical protein M9H77_28797 [Catharanthus roseus]|uniref:Uncharacterized protein n=1 Tax=Catharanthus roseus TaxID=4058 RepID=A0ACC0AHB9_CATRO|nr:hypothetical protein M9H77_28797 [Catharanthus roseus]
MSRKVEEEENEEVEEEAPKDETEIKDYLNNASVCWSNFASLVRVYITVLPELIIIVAVAASSDSVLISNRKMSWHWHIYDLICVCFNCLKNVLPLAYELCGALFWVERKEIASLIFLLLSFFLTKVVSMFMLSEHKNHKVLLAYFGILIELMFA